MSVKEIVFPGFKENFKIALRLAVIGIIFSLIIVLTTVLAIFNFAFALLWLPIILVSGYFMNAYLQSLYFNILLKKRLNTDKRKLSKLFRQVFSVLAFGLIIGLISQPLVRLVSAIITINLELMLILLPLFFIFLLALSYFKSLFISMFFMGVFDLQLKNDIRFGQPFMVFIQNFKTDFKNLSIPFLIFTAIRFGADILLVIIITISIISWIMTGSIFISALMIIISLLLFCYIQVAYMQLLANLYVKHADLSFLNDVDHQEYNVDISVNN